MTYRTIALLACCALLGLLVSCTEVAEPDTPSILVISADDLGNHLGSYGDTTVPTPNLDKLAAGGTRFTRAYVTQPSCSSSRASFLTGLYPHQNGQLGLAHEGFTMTGEWPVIPGILKEQLGYFTALGGKLHVGPRSTFGFFDALELEDGPLWTRDVELVGEKAASYFSQARGRAFYIQFDLRDPHRPFESSIGGLPVKPIGADQVKPFSWTNGKGHDLATDTADYYNSVSRMDSIVGRIIAELREAGRLENTIIIFWSDNGPPFPRAKTRLYEQGTRVPMIIAGPGVKAGQVREELVSMVDIMPTVLQMTGATLPTVPALYTGKDLTPLLRGEDVAWREFMFTEETFHTPLQWAPARAITNGKWKLIDNLPVGDSREKIELFHLDKDPDERINLANRAPRKIVRDRLLDALAQWRARTGDPLLDTSIYHRLDGVHVNPQSAVEPWYRPLVK